MAKEPRPTDRQIFTALALLTTDQLLHWLVFEMIARSNNPARELQRILAAFGK